MTELTLTTSRPATAKEVEDLVFGTGVLAMPWWNGAHKTEHGFRFYFDRPEDDEGTFDGVRWVSNQKILDAAGQFLAEGQGSDAGDMLKESIGYADASDADVILQYAVLGKLVYG